MARGARSLGGDRRGRRRGDAALRGCRRAWGVRGTPARRYGFVRGRAGDAPSRHGSPWGGRRAGERHASGRARRGRWLVAGLRALAAGLRAPHDRRCGGRRRSACRRSRRGQIVGRPRALVLRARTPRSRGRRTGGLGCRGCPDRGERYDRAGSADRRVPLERPVSRRPHQADDPWRRYRRRASRARPRDGPATAPDGRCPGRSGPAPPRVRAGPCRDRRPRRRTRSRCPGERRDPRSSRPRRPPGRGRRPPGDPWLHGRPFAAGAPRASPSPSSVSCHSSRTTSRSRRSASASASRRRRSSRNRLRSTRSWALRPAATPSTWPSTPGSSSASGRRMGRPPVA